MNDVIQIVSIIAACIAALGSWRAASVISKQYKLQQGEKIKKYRPIFKIKSYHENNNRYVFDIVNEGFPAFSINYVKWDGEGVIVKEFFNAEINRTKTRGRERLEMDRYENLTIIIEIRDNITTEGFIEINGFDIEGNAFTLKTPLIQIEKGTITNGIKLTYQYIL